MATKMIQDEFGKKIGGSKRDLWKLRGLMVADLEDMNAAEQEKYVKKDSIFKTPDYQAMKDEGMDIRVIYFIKLVKDAIAVKPQYHIMTNSKESYIETVTMLKEKLLALKTWEDCETFLLKVVMGEHLIERANHSLNVTEVGENVGVRKIYKAIRYLSSQSIMREIKKKEFLYTDFDKYAKNYSYFRKGATEYVTERETNYLKHNLGMSMIKNLDKETFDAIGSEEYILLKNRFYFVASGTEDEVKELIKNLFETKQTVEASIPKEEKKANRKRKFIPVSLNACRRIKNGEDARVFMHINPEQMIDTFGFYGGEFGNWLNDDTRQESLDRSYEAFEDLATALNISTNQISLNGRLSIAYGARGNGGAAAHYEPEREVINLTKFSGAGSLAHEYGHGLDDILSKLYGNTKAFSETPRTLNSMRELLGVMKYKNASVTVYRKEFDKQIERDKRYLINGIDAEFRKATEEGKKEVREYLDKNVFLSREELLSLKGDNDDFDFRYEFIGKVLSDLDEKKKTLVPRGKNLKSDCRNMVRWTVDSYINNITKPDEYQIEKRVKTDFYSGSLKFDEEFQKSDKGYWASDVEMFARCFSCYVEDKLKEKGIINDYLAGKSDCFVLPGDEVFRAYPVGEERKVINEHIDAFLSELKALGLFEVKKAA